MSRSNYTELVLTGGPCAGKSTALAHLRAASDKLGALVITVPEVATMIHETGFPINPEEDQSFLAFQSELVRAQGELRSSYQRLARSLAPQRVLIVYDRAEMDTAAYVSAETHSEILRELGLERAVLRDSYDAVFHLVTAAKGAEGAYTRENNAARRENQEEAKDADTRTLQAWLGHPHLRIISNREDFQMKIGRVISEAERLLGIGSVGAPVEIERKWLLAEKPDMEMLSELAHRSEITQIYLHSNDDVERRIRERIDSDGSVTRTLTEKREVRSERGAPLQRVEYERLISKREFETLSESRVSLIRKTRWVFAHSGRVFELDRFERSEPIWILEAEFSSIEESDVIEPPEWIGPIRDVSDDPSFKSASLATPVS